MVYAKLWEQGNPPKPVPAEGEMACIECYGHGILREIRREGHPDHGYRTWNKCDFCGWRESFDVIAPAARGAFDAIVGMVLRDLREERRPRG